MTETLLIGMVCGLGFGVPMGAAITVLSLLVWNREE